MCVIDEKDFRMKPIAQPHATGAVFDERQDRSVTHPPRNFFRPPTGVNEELDTFWNRFEEFLSTPG